MWPVFAFLNLRGRMRGCLGFSCEIRKRYACGRLCATVIYFFVAAFDKWRYLVSAGMHHCTFRVSTGYRRHLHSHVSRCSLRCSAFAHEPLLSSACRGATPPRPYSVAFTARERIVYRSFCLCLLPASGSLCHLLVGSPSQGFLVRW